MSLRFIPWSVLVTGLALLGSACGPTADAADQTAALEAAKGGEFCGGIAGIACAEGFTCVDDPNDTCDPNQGGADCGGICQAEKKKACNYDDPSRTYVSQDPDQCAVIRFTCPEGQSAFFDDCGCGCTTTP